MNCKFVVVLACLTNEDDQKEIQANAASLKTKYDSRATGGGQQQVVSVEVRQGMTNPEIWGAIEDACKVIPRDEKDVGVYFLCHGVANNMWPSATALATLTLKVTQDLKFGFRKICLAACRSAGQKLNNGSFQASPMHEFCKFIEAKLAEAKYAASKPLLNDVFVTGWEVYITTYNEKQEYWDAKTGGWKNEEKGPTELEVGPRLVNQPVGRSAVMDYKDQTLSLVSTHPKMEVQSNNSMMQSIEKIVAEQWKLNRAIYKCADVDTYRQALAADKLSVPHQGMFFKQVNKNLKDDQQLLGSLVSYMRTKVVARYSALTGKWAIAGLADYTDNADLSKMLKLAWSCDATLQKSFLSIGFQP